MSGLPRAALGTGLPLAALGAADVVGLLVALAVCVYLVYALLRGEEL